MLADLGGEPRCALFSFPTGEPQKTRATWSDLTDRLLAAGFGRDTAIVALGGGVVGDVAGFVAATFLRGIPYVQVPTTLLAMIDSSIGGKTGVDTPQGKNLVGAFHQPAVVVADASTLKTLPERHVSAGIAEAIKHGAIADARYFEWLVADCAAILARDVDTLQEVVRRSVEIKAAVVSDDVKEQGKRAVLNFGHTFGHAIEAVTGYRSLHGEAVAIGMVAEVELGLELGITDPAVPDRLRAAAAALRLPATLPHGVAPERVLQTMEQDKKKRRGHARFALLERLGRVARTAAGEWTHAATEPAISRVLDRMK